MNQSSCVSNPWFRSVLLMLLVISVALACSKKDDGNPNPALLTSVEGNWKVNSLKLNGTLDVLPSLTATYGSCLNDITLSFKTGGAVGFDNPVSCSSGAALTAFTGATGIDAASKWSQSGSTLTITSGTGTPKSFTTVFGTSTVQLQGSGLFALSGTPPANYNFTLELRKL